jgi:hypothetical protein
MLRYFRKTFRESESVLVSLKVGNHAMEAYRSSVVQLLRFTLVEPYVALWCTRAATLYPLTMAMCIAQIICLLSSEFQQDDGQPVYCNSGESTVGEQSA